MWHDQISGIIIKGFCCSGGLRIYQDCPSMITVSVFGCTSVVFVPHTRMSSSYDFVQEYSMPFCEMTDDSFDFHVIKNQNQVKLSY